MEKIETLDVIERQRQEISRLRMSNENLSNTLLWYKKLWLRLDRLIQTHPNDSLQDFVKALFQKES